MAATAAWLVCGCAGDSTYVPLPEPRQPVPEQSQGEPTAEAPGEPQAAESPAESPEQPAQESTEPTAPPPPPPQGQTCSDGPVKLTASKPLESCAGLDVVVEASSPYAWVMVGVGAPSMPTSWRGGVSGDDISCSGDHCRWTFRGVTVPCHAGPYTLQLRVDAKEDNPSVGRIVATCEP